MGVEKHVTPFPGKHITFTTPKSFDAVSARLLECINPHDEVVSQKQLDDFFAAGDPSKFSSYFASHAGPHEFTELRLRFNFGSMLKLFGLGNGLRTDKYYLGNPKTGIAMVDRELDAGLFVPPEMLLKELPDGKGTKVMYVQPSSIMTATNRDEELVKFAEVVDVQLDTLVRDITSVD